MELRHDLAGRWPVRTRERSGDASADQVVVVRRGGGRAFQEG
jgi:hypothetical protein